jgi:DNA sulfur modification protein DndC
MEDKKMMPVDSYQQTSFAENGIDNEVELLMIQIQTLYLSDGIPWVIGYSGGKDSTACLQLVWNAVKDLPVEQRLKPVYVISTDTLVENPVVAMWVEASLEKMRIEAEQQGVPIIPQRLTPSMADRFWVNLIGKGYPAPRPMFRWCTSRLKINPSNQFILDMVDKNGEAILVLGTRKAESSTRKRSMELHEGSTRQFLSRNGNPKLDRVWIYPPIVSWSNDDVWEYLVTYDNPWGFDNNQLLNMYRGATQDNECPLIVDTSTPSCGDSRFGCFVCTLVDKDKSMSAMIRNDDEKKWMSPLADFRNNYLDVANDFHRRDFRRMNGTLNLMTDKETGKQKLVHGPYLQSYRETLLLELLKAQEKVRASGVRGTENFQLIPDDEVEEIRRIWVREKNEIEDSVPVIYKSATGRDYPYGPIDEGQLFKPEDILLLKTIAAEEHSSNELHYQLVRNLLNIERSYSTATRRVGIYDNLEKALTIGGFDNAEEALKFAEMRLDNVEQAEEHTQKITDVSGIYQVVEEGIRNGEEF